MPVEAVIDFIFSCPFFLIRKGERIKADIKGQPHIADAPPPCRPWPARPAQSIFGEPTHKRLCSHSCPHRGQGSAIPYALGIHSHLCPFCLDAKWTEKFKAKTIDPRHGLPKRLTFKSGSAFCEGKCFAFDVVKRKRPSMKVKLLVRPLGDRCPAFWPLLPALPGLFWANPIKIPCGNGKAFMLFIGGGHGSLTKKESHLPPPLIMV